MCILVEELEHASEDLLSHVNTHNKLCRKIENIADLSLEEINQVKLRLFLTGNVSCILPQYLDTWTCWFA